MSVRLYPRPAPPILSGLIQFIDRINAANDPATRPWIAADFPDGGRHPCGAKRSSRRASPCPNAVIGVWTDENDVERVRIYPVLRQAPP